MQITLGIEAGEASNAAVSWLSAQTFAADADITLVTSFDMIVSDPLDDEEIIEVRARRIRNEIPGASVSTALADGSIPNVLGLWTRGADLLVIGSRRSNHARAVLAGALPERLAAATSVPIAIVPDDWHGRTGGIVAGVADDDSSDDAVAFASDLAERHGLALRLVHARRHANQVAEQDRRLLDVADLVRARHPRLELTVMSPEGSVFQALGPPHDNTSMIVVGSHRHGLISGWIVGSVAQGLIKNSRTTICVVPPGTYLSRSVASFSL